MSFNWTEAYQLELLLSAEREQRHVHGVKLRRGEHVVKTLQLSQGSEDPETKEDAFLLPSKPCREAEDVTEPVGKVELMPPHRRSSALNDFLLVLADNANSLSAREGRPWDHVFMLLSAISVPGDVAVMIEDPEPPSFEALGSMGFSYTATVYRLGKLRDFDTGDDEKHSSEGSVWLDPASRSFRLSGEAKSTKVGPLYMDILARGGDEAEGAKMDLGKAKVYGNVNLTVQKRQQCLIYDWPQSSENASHDLLAVAEQKLMFYATTEVRGEDCAIFVAPLLQKRWIHLYVDMESDRPDAILRAEIHRAGKLLRTVDVRHWHSSEKAKAALQPEPGWHCASGTVDMGQLAHLGMREQHLWSQELLETLQALRLPSSSFAARSAGRENRGAGLLRVVVSSCVQCAMRGA